MRDADAMAQAAERVAERRAARHTTHHGAEWSHKHHCEHCADYIAERDTNHAAIESAQRVASERAKAQNAQKVTRPMSGDTPQKISRKARVTRKLDTPTIAGDTTRNAPARKTRATQRYSHDTIARAVSDTRVTRETDATFLRVIRSHSPLLVREGGETDTRATLYVIAAYRHILATRRPRTTN